MHDIVETGGDSCGSGAYDGYLHLKVLPGAARADIHDAARVAKRGSASTWRRHPPTRLGSIAGVKD